MTRPILAKRELKRLPFQRRPIAEPGTTLVFQMADGRLTAPEHPYTAGEIWWKGPKWVYVVDVRSHGGSFACQLPSLGDALFFQATVVYTWSVHDPVLVVRHLVANPAAECQGYLQQRLPAITRRHDFRQAAEVEADLHHALGGGPLILDGRGLRIEDVHTYVRMDEGQRTTVGQLQAAPLEQRLAEERAHGTGRIKQIDEEHELRREAMRQKQMEEIVSGGPEKLYAFIIQEDKTKGLEVLSRMQAMTERQEQRTLEAIKVLIDGGEIRVGEMDGAVAAAVERIGAIIGRDAAAVTAGQPELEQPGAAGRGAVPPDRASGTGGGVGDDG